MINRKFFFDHARATLFGGTLNTNQVKGLTAILDEWEKNYSKKDDRWLAYILATAHYENDKKFIPIEEYGKGAGLPYGSKLKMTKKNGKRIPYSTPNKIYYGRGFVQLTWYENYDLMGKKLGIDLLNQPERALELSIAIQILFIGMTKGLFTGKKLSDYFSPIKNDWENARRIINGTDKAKTIADIGRSFYACISYTV